MKDDLFSSPTGAAWKRIGTKHRHGIAIPLGAIHTEMSCGCGEYLDLIPLIDWCAQVGFTVIQLLPLNDSGGDPSPYNAQSMYALHPIYLSLAPFKEIDTAPFAPLKETSHIAYHALLAQKLSALKEYFIRNRPSTDQGRYPWLRPYALFKVLKEEFGEVSWTEWPAPYNEPTPERLELWIEERSEAIAFHCFLQLAAIDQLTAVRRHADSKGVLLKGDIPFLVSPDSADIWLHQPLFDLRYAAGSPPDVFTTEGQYWGFPLYNWEAIKATGYALWHSRLDFASSLYHLYRIDHIIGFFRLWIIPRGLEARDGWFSPRTAEERLSQGRTILTELASASMMLPIGENLGVVPPDVDEVLEELGICGTKVFRWERNYPGDHRFIPSSDYNPINMTSISTHDSEPLELWWRDYPQEASDYCKHKGWHYAPNITPEQRRAILYESHHTPTIFHINLLQEYLGLVPELTWDDPERERINLPGTVLPTNWTYRYRFPLEILTASEALRSAIASLNLMPPS